MSVVKQRSALLSVSSNSTLILLKVIAGTLTGSVSILTEAVHSSVDLIASLVAYVSVRKADEPADDSHRYGHQKIESLSAAIEGMLILVGSAVIVFESVRRLLTGGQIHTVGFGIAVVAISAVVNVIVSGLISRTARRTESAALAGDAAHLRTDAFTSGGVLVGLVLVQMTGLQWIDPVMALIVASAIVFSGVRLIERASSVLVDQSLPPAEISAIQDAIASFGPRGVVGYHALRTRRAGARRYVDLHLQFRAGMSLEAAHQIAHELQDAISGNLAGVDVLIHLEPEDRIRPGEVISED